MKFRHFYLFLALFVSCEAYAQTAITLEQRRDMDFASIAADPAGDTITLTPADDISGTNVSLFIGGTQAALFRARGDRNSAVTISFSSGDFLSGPGANISLGNFVHDAGATPTIGNNQQLNFNVGATLTINPAQLGGDYSGTYSVFVDYQ